MGDTASPIPAQVDDITAEWLNEVLHDRPEFATIESVGTAHFGEGVGILGELARLSLTYAVGETGPATIVAKCASPSTENQFLATAMGFYIREVNFYRQLAERVDVRVPRPYHAEASDTGVPFVLLIEDISASRTPDQLSGIGVDDARRIISTVVPLHAQFWGNDELFGLDWLPPMNNDLYKGGQVMAEALFPPFAERYADRIPTAVVDTIGEACARYAEMLDFVVTVGTPTFTHTDCRAENYLFCESDRPAGGIDVTMVDFQLSTRHVGMWDVTNLLAGSMDPADREQHEHDLIGSYVEGIVASGIDFSIEQAMFEYRVCLLQQTVAQVITSDLQGGNDRGTALLEQLHLRPIHAAAAHDVGEILDLF